MSRALPSLSTHSPQPSITGSPGRLRDPRNGAGSGGRKSRGRAPTMTFHQVPPLETLSRNPHTSSPLWMQLQHCCPPRAQHSPRSLEGRPRACRTRMVSKQVPGTFAYRGHRHRLLQADEPNEDKGQRGGWGYTLRPNPEPKSPALPSHRPEQEGVSGICG